MRAFWVILFVTVASQVVLAEDPTIPPNSSSNESDSTDSAESQEARINLNQARCIVRNVNLLVGALDNSVRQIEQCTKDVTGIPGSIISQIQRIKQITQAVRSIANSLRRFNLLNLIRGVSSLLGNLQNFLTNLTSIIEIVVMLDNPNNDQRVQCVKDVVRGLQAPLNNLKNC